MSSFLKNLPIQFIDRDNFLSQMIEKIEVEHRVSFRQGEFASEITP